MKTRLYASSDRAYENAVKDQAQGFVIRSSMRCTACIIAALSIGNIVLRKYTCIDMIVLSYLTALCYTARASILLLRIDGSRDTRLLAYGHCGTESALTDPFSR